MSTERSFRQFPLSSSDAGQRDIIHFVFKTIPFWQRRPALQISLTKSSGYGVAKKLLGMADEIRTFIRDNDGALKKKE
jgi:hypothetical protein